MALPWCTCGMSVCVLGGRVWMWVWVWVWVRGWVFVGGPAVSKAACKTPSDHHTRHMCGCSGHNAAELLENVLENDSQLQTIT